MAPLSALAGLRFVPSILFPRAVFCPVVARLRSRLTGFIELTMPGDQTDEKDLIWSFACLMRNVALWPNPGNRQPLFRNSSTLRLKRWALSGAEPVTRMALHFRMLSYAPSIGICDRKYCSGKPLRMPMDFMKFPIILDSSPRKKHEPI